jgi:hypothetical protein
VSNPSELPCLPESRIEPSGRKVSELKPGEQVILSVILDIAVDEEGHVRVDTSSRVRSSPLVAGLTLRAERTEAGFILWLDKKVKLTLGRLYHEQFLPVVEFRDAANGGN